MTQTKCVLAEMCFQGRLDKLPAICFEALLDGEIMRVNAYGKNVLGMDAGKDIKTFFESPATWDEIVDSVRRDQQLAGKEFYLRSANGNKYTAVWLYAFMDSSVSEVPCVQGVLYDLTEKNRFVEVLMASRDKLRVVFDAISDLIISVDMDYKVVSANMAAARWANKDIREIIGLDCQDVLNKECARKKGKIDKCSVYNVFKTGKSVKIEKELVGVDGKYRWFSLQAFPIRDKAGAIYQVAFVLQDIHERKENEKRISLLNEELRKKNEHLKNILIQLKEAQSHLLQSEKMASIGQLAAGVAHEINNPVGFINSNLTTFRSYCNDLKEMLELYGRLEKRVAQEGAIPEEIKELLENIEEKREAIDLEFILEDLDELIDQSIEGTERIKKIIQDLKEFSHVDQAELKEVDINRCLESTLNIVWNELKYKATVKKEYGDIPLILGYPQQLNQVFMNLLVNAAQAIEEKGEITIITREVKSPTHGVEILIKDTGVGIPKEIQPKIFDPFFTTKPVGKGTGLGLNVSYKIIQKHRGRIEVESDVGKGATFSIFLPKLTRKDFEEKNADYSNDPASIWRDVSIEKIDVDV